VTLSIIVFEPETRIGEYLRVVQFTAPPPIDGLACWGMLDDPGGSRKEGRKKGRGRKVPLVCIYKKMSVPRPIIGLIDISMVDEGSDGGV